MILFRADANSNIGLGHIMRCLSIADALSSITTEPTIVRGKDSIKFVLADETVSELIKSRGYEPIVLHTDYNCEFFTKVPLKCPNMIKHPGNSSVPAYFFHCV